MGADLHIHIFDSDEMVLTEEDMKCFFSSTVGSKWGPPEDDFWNPRYHRCSKCEYPAKYWKDLTSHWYRVGNTPNVWIGSVSWLKAALLEDPDQFIPHPVDAVNELIGENLPVVDDDFIEKIAKALDLENQTSYHVAAKEEVVKFLEGFKGKRVFTVSW